MNEIKSNADESKGNGGWMKKVVACAAAAALIVGCSLGLGNYQKAQAAETVVSVDAGSDVSVGVDGEDVVVSVYDNVSNVEKSDVKGMKINDAVRVIVGRMVESGSISEDNDVVLVSVQDAASKAGDEFNDEVTDEAEDETEDANAEVEGELADVIEEELNKLGINGTVIGQRFSEDEAIRKVAEEFSISTGKASFIQKVLSSNKTEEGAQVGDFANKSIKTIVEYAASLMVNTEVTVGGDDDVSDITGSAAAEGSANAGVSVSVNDDANVNVTTGADGSASTHVNVDEGDVKVDVETGANFSLGVEVDGESFTYDSSDPGGSMVGIINSIIKAS